MFVWQAHGRAVTSLAFGPDGRFLLSGGDDSRVKAWEPFSGGEQFAIPVADVTRCNSLRWLTLSGNGKWAAVHEHSRRLLFLDLEHERVAAERNITEIYALKRTPDGESVALLIPGHYLNSTPEFRACDFDSQFDTHPPVAGLSPLSRALAFSPDGTQAAIGRSHYRWPPKAGAQGSYVHTKNFELDDLAFSANNEYLFALVGGKVVVYSLLTGLFKTKLKGHNGTITAMELAPDGRRLWTASRDATVKCWDTHLLTLDRTFRFDTGWLSCLAVSPDGNVAAVGSGQKGTITVWDLG